MSQLSDSYNIYQILSYPKVSHRNLNYTFIFSFHVVYLRKHKYQFYLIKLFIGYPSLFSFLIFLFDVHFSSHENVILLNFGF